MTSRINLQTYAPVTSTRDAVAERLQSLNETAPLLYNRMEEKLSLDESD